MTGPMAFVSRDADPHACRPEGQEDQGACFAVPDGAAHQARRHRRAAVARRRAACAAAGDAGRRHGRAAGFHRAAVLRQRQVHDGDRPCLHLQHRVVQQAVVRRTCRPISRRIVLATSQGGRATRSSPGRWISWFSSARCGSTRAAKSSRLSAADHAELMQKMAPIGPDIVKSQARTQAAVGAAARGGQAQPVASTTGRRAHAGFQSSRAVDPLRLSSPEATAGHADSRV